MNFVNFYSNILAFIRSYWTAIIIIGIPILFLPLALSKYTAYHCMYILFIVAFFWITEVTSLAVTSLIPFVLFPAFGILTPGEAASCYMKDITMMLIGGLIVAKTIEEQNLHTRFALRILMLMGPNPIFEYFGFMLSSWFLSMWISNTATTAMMVTLAGAVINEWKLIAGVIPDEKSNNIEENNSTKIEMEEVQSGKGKPNKELEKIEVFSKGLYLSIAYSATCGGIATLTGTPPNLVFYGFMEEKYGSKLGLNFGTFFLFAFPISIITLIFAWIAMCIRYVGIKQIFKRERNSIKDEVKMKMIKRQYDGLGPMSFGEISALFVFLILVLLWLLREPGIPIWGSLFIYKNKHGVDVKYWSDATSAVMAAIVVFILPAKNPFHKLNHKEAIPKLLNWRKLEKDFSWGLVFLFGGGFTLAAGCSRSGLSDIIGHGLTNLANLPEFTIILLITLGISFLTEIISNTATSTILIPIMLKMAECIQMHPLKIALATGIAASFSFSLPAGTPPNAIIFSTGKLRVIDMISSGIFLNILCSFVLAIMCCYYSIPIFKTNIFPSWINVNCSGL